MRLGRFGSEKRVLVLASVASMLGQFNASNIRLLAGHGFQVDVAANFESGNTVPDGKLGELAKEYQASGITVWNLPIPRNLWDIRGIIASYRRIRRLCDRNHYQIVHCQSPVGGAIARLGARKSRRDGTKVIYTAHGFHFYKGAPIRNWLLIYPAEWLLAWWTDTLVTINREDYLRAVRHFHAGKVVYVPGVGVDTKRFHMPVTAQKKRLRQEAGIGTDTILLLSVGELNKNKNHETVIRALAILSDSRYHYCIAGCGDRQAYLRRLARSLGVSSQVHLLGYREDVARLLQLADIYLLPSIREGLNVSLMEAMASGLACICSDIRGNRDLIVAGRGGYRMGSRDVHAWAKAIQKLGRDASLRGQMGTFNRKRVAYFSADVVEKRMAGIYGIGRVVDFEHIRKNHLCTMFCHRACSIRKSPNY